MIEFAPITSSPYSDFGAIAVLLHGRPIGYLVRSADGRSASVTQGFGFEAQGCGDVYDRDCYGRAMCIYRAAAELILVEGRHQERIVG